MMIIEGKCEDEVQKLLKWKQKCAYVLSKQIAKQNLKCALFLSLCLDIFQNSAAVKFWWKSWESSICEINIISVSVGFLRFCACARLWDGLVFYGSRVSCRQKSVFLHQFLWAEAGGRCSCRSHAESRKELVTDTNTLIHTHRSLNWVCVCVYVCVPPALSASWL